MKGIVFCEFVEMMENRFSPELADEVMSEAKLRSGGAYTTVGTYDYNEMLALVMKLSEKTGTPVPELVEDFGRYLFGRFFTLYPSFFEGVSGSFDFLKQIEHHVHVEVLKLYPDAQLPHFDTSQPNADTLVMLYSSARPFANLAWGLINGCIEHYKETMDVDMKDMSGGGLTKVRFTLTKQ